MEGFYGLNCQSVPALIKASYMNQIYFQKESHTCEKTNYGSGPLILKVVVVSGNSAGRTLVTPRSSEDAVLQVLQKIKRFTNRVKIL